MNPLRLPFRHFGLALVLNAIVILHDLARRASLLLRRRLHVMLAWLVSLISLALRRLALTRICSTAANRPFSLSLLAFWVLTAVATASIMGCQDKAKISEEAAKVNVEAMVSLANEDVAEIERGLPEGGRKLATELAKEPGEPGKEVDPQRVRAALLRVRQLVPDLTRAKSTFFAFTDTHGIAVRNDLEQDVMAGKDLAGAYPALKKALAGEVYVATNGQFPGVPNPAGPDKEWVAGVPVKKDDGTLVGLYVTGWTYRRFAYHLQESLKHDLQQHLLSTGELGKLPIFYVLLFDPKTTYGARGTPPINEKTLADMNLVQKTAAGRTSGTVTIDNRTFGWAAERVPKLGDDVGIVVLRSEV
ncbi:MAG: hypothetical protein FWD73_10290 [Polyangiaceae bacterium]|nr:hypothetical protein [Polyangiaceae bacterium]